MVIETTGVKYLGSKASFITDIITQTHKVVNDPREWCALDVFLGSSRVAQAYRQVGFKTLTSELLPAGAAYAETYICNDTCDRTLVAELIDQLNAVAPVEGWLTRTYGEALPAEDKGSGKMVNAFTRANAMKADAIRDTIETLRPELKRWEYMTLITSLIMALNKVQNSQGHSRAFFREFMKSALQPIVLEMPPLVGNSTLSFSSDKEFINACPVGAHFTGNVLSEEYVEFVKQHAGSKRIVAYLDPPYTTNLPYNQFYHIWDSIVLWDKPEVVGATNRRKDRAVVGRGLTRIAPALESEWTKKSQARNAFVDLYTALNFVDAFVISYSDESILKYDEMLELFTEMGLTLQDVVHKEYQRHALSKTATASAETRATAAKTNTEWVFLVTK